MLKLWLSVLTEMVHRARVGWSHFVRFALKRIRNPDPLPMHLLQEAVDEMFVASAYCVVSAKHRTIICVAERKRYEHQTETEDMNVAEWEKRAELAERDGDAILAREALMTARRHRDLAEVFRDTARLKALEVEIRKQELLSFHRAVESARAARDRLTVSVNDRARFLDVNSLRKSQEEREVATSAETLRLLQVLVDIERSWATLTSIQAQKAPLKGGSDKPN